MNVCLTVCATIALALNACSGDAGDTTTTSGDGGVRNGDAQTGQPGNDAGADAFVKVVSPCPLLDAATTDGGEWKDITPPGLSLDFNFKTPAGDNYGASAFVVDPQDTATVYLGSSAQGVFKTTDCGATWVHISHGDVDKGRNGTMVIDPTDRNILYTDGRYGPLGVFKSIDGGVNWTQILPPDIAAAFVDGGMVEWIAIDPTDHLHLTVSPHFTCAGQHAPNCMLETTDGGTTWKILDNTPPVAELGGHIMLDRKTWLSAQPMGGLWRTTDGGVTWTQVSKGQIPATQMGATS